MALVIAHAELVSDQTSDPRTAPQRRREAVRLGAFQQQRLEAFELRGVQQRLTAGAAGLAQPGFAVTPVSSQPLADTLPRDLQSPRCLGLTTALLDQPDRFETALLQGLKIPPYAFCISHTYKDVRTPKRCHFILRDSIGTVFRWSGQRPRGIWQQYRLPLSENHFLRMEGDNTFSQVLQNLARVEISGDLAKGPEANGLDNFTLRTEYVAPSGRALFLDPEVLIVHGAEGDETVAVPPFQVSGTSTSVSWEALVQPASAVWLSASPETGTTPSQVQLAIDATDLTEGVHEAEVLIRESEFRVPRATARVILVLAESRTRPRISEGGVIHAAAAGLPLSPGGLASVFGENFAPAEQDSDFLEGTTNLLREGFGREGARAKHRRRVD